MGTAWQAVARDVRAVDSVAQLPAAGWDELAGPGDLFLSRPWLRVAETTSGVPMTYLFGEDEHGLTAGLPTALLGTDVPWLLGRPDTLAGYCAGEGLDGAADFLAGLPGAPAGVLMPSLVCGGRHLGGTRALTRAGLSDPAGVTGRLVAAAEDLMRERQARSAAFLYVDERDTVLRQVLAARGYASFTSSSYSWLPVPDGGFGGYTATLSAHRRRRIEAERRRLRTAGVRVRLEPLTAELVPPVSALDVSLLVKYGARATQEQAEQTFGRIHREFGDDAAVVTARLDGELCGFALVLRHRDHWYVYRCGFDYAVKGDLPVYFEVLFYHLIEAAPGAGVSVIHYGTGSTAAKQSRGCHTTQQYAFVMPGQ